MLRQAVHVLSEREVSNTGAVSLGFIPFVSPHAGLWRGEREREVGGRSSWILLLHLVSLNGVSSVAQDTLDLLLAAHPHPPIALVQPRLPVLRTEEEATEGQ